MRAECVATLRRRASENRLIKEPSRPRPRPRDAAPWFIQICDWSRVRFPLHPPSSSHQRTLQGKTPEKEQTWTGIPSREPVPGFGDRQFPDPGLQRKNPKQSPSSSKSLLW